MSDNYNFIDNIPFNEVLSKVMKDIWIFKQINEKIFLFVNVDWFFYSHRLPIAKAALNHDIDMLFILTLQIKKKCKPK